VEGGIVVQANSSWTVRVNREDLLTIQVDGTDGSAVAGLRDCKIQHRVNTPRPLWNPDIPNPIQFMDQWQEVPANDKHENAFKLQWEMFLKHIACDEPFPWTLLEGAKGSQLSELGLLSWKERRWVEVPNLTIGGKADEYNVNVKTAES
jgi:predicted dehydrogenase